MPQATTVPQLHEFVAAQLPKVFVAIEGHIDRAVESLPSAGTDYSNLWRSIGSQFAGGKRLRPSLMIAAYGGFGGDDPDSAVPVAAATEMLHISMLIHDDIIDHDEVRRGKPNVAGIRRSEVVGSSLSQAEQDDTVLAAAILGGDLAISSAYDLVARATLPAHHRLACLNLVTRAVRHTIAGELLDAYGSHLAPERSRPMLVSELKTSTYTCVVPLLAGAQLAGADPTMVTHLERLGTHMGLSFQLTDDDLGVFGDPDVTGKSVLSDLRSGKRTELLRLTLELAENSAAARIRELVGDAELDDAGAADVREVMTASGGRARALALAGYHASQARSIAAERVPVPLSGYIDELVSSLERRTS